MSDRTFSARRDARGTASLHRTRIQPAVSQPIIARNIRPFVLGAGALAIVGGVCAGLLAVGWNRDAAVSSPMPATAPSSNRVAGHIDQSGHCYVEGLIDGEMMTLMVDSGASRIVFSRNQLRRLGIDPSTLHFTQSVRTATGTVRAAEFTLHEVRLGR